MNQVRADRVPVAGGSLYYRTEGSGPVLLIMGGGPSSADTLAPLAAQLAADFTVVCYDRRGYSRSEVTDGPVEPADVIARHAADARRLIAALGAGPVSVFGTSFGALIALELAATAPAAVATVIVHEPPLGQLLAGRERQPFELNLDAEQDAGAALNAIAASVGVSRGRGLGVGGSGVGGSGLAGSGAAGSGAAGSGAAGAGPARADVELFIRRDAPAIGDYRLDIYRLRPMAGRLIVTGSEGSRDFYPYQCTMRLAGQLGLPLTELPGNHAGMIQQPARFAARLRYLLLQPACRETGLAGTHEGVTT